jgi:phage terminase large subunit
LASLLKEQSNKEVWGKYERHYKVAFLAEPHPYKVLWGGRDGIKSWSIARQLVVDAATHPIRTLCCRETMMSLDESVMQLLSDQIHLLKLDAHFQILQKEIRGINGSLFSFAGLRTDARKIKSFEGYDRAWVEEANNVSKNSWQILIPTIRKEGSEIWISFNPELESDYTYQFWIVNPPPGTVKLQTSFHDNIWLTKKSHQEIEFMKETAYDDYLNIYEGECIQTIKGAVFTKEMAKVDADHRILHVPYTNVKPVDLYVDLGDRYTSIWFAQSVGYETRLIDFLDSEGMGLQLIIKELQRREYIYGTTWLPWDARMPQLSTGRTIEEQLRSANFKVNVIPQVSFKARLNMCRLLFPQLVFDGDNCADGIQALRHYKWPKEGVDGQVKTKPLHDVNSHPADALMYMAVVLKTPIIDASQKSQKRREVVSPWV